MLKFISSLLFGVLLAAPSAVYSGQVSVERNVLAIQKADYQGDRAALERLYHETDSIVSEGKATAKLLYWRGFAKWRRAINGVNDSIKAEITVADMENAAREFAAARAKDPSFVDAKIGEASCLMAIAFSGDGSKAEELVPKFVGLLNESRKEAPENPRYYWVNGVGIWYVPANRGGGEDAAIAGYLKGLELCGKGRNTSHDPLDPNWGQPELLMSLAWSNLNRKKPDLSAAEKYAKQALKLVPYWHYVRDILLPQIERAKKERGAWCSARIFLGGQ